MSPRTLPFSIAAVVFLLDRLTKSWVRGRVGAFDIHRVIPGFFNIVHTENPGAAFSLLADASGAWRSVFLIGLSATVAVFIAVMLWRGAEAGLVRAGLALVLGGALGNLFDRVVSGTVTDFLELYYGTYYFPAFNVADSAISIGAGLLLIDMIRGRSKKLEPQSLDVP